MVDNSEQPDARGTSAPISAAAAPAQYRHGTRLYLEPRAGSSSRRSGPRTARLSCATAATAATAGR
jgi:hypothetical protein